MTYQTAFILVISVLLWVFILSTLITHLGAVGALIWIAITATLAALWVADDMLP